MTDPVVRRRNISNKRRGADNERALVNELKAEGFKSARKVIGSGRYAAFKGDIEVPEVSALLEAKVYESHVTPQGGRYVRFDLGWVPKAEEEAIEMGFKHSAVILRAKGSSDRFAVISMEEYTRYLKYIKEK